MTVPTGAVQTFAMVGIREELSDVITNISPMDVPFYSMCRKGKTKSRSPEWLKDSLQAADPTNAVVEGDDAEPVVAGHFPEDPGHTVRQGRDLMAAHAAGHVEHEGDEQARLVDQLADVLPVTPRQEIEGPGSPFRRSRQALAFNVLAKQGNDVPKAIGHRIDGPFFVLFGHWKSDNGLVRHCVGSCGCSACEADCKR